MEANEGTKPVSQQHAFDVAALQRYLRSAMPDFPDAALTVEQFKGGQSNPTYKLVTPQAAYVMRSKPGPAAKLLPSAHAIEREFRVQRALAGTDVPVSKMHLLCEDESVIGRAFYIMQFVAGRVLWDQSMPDYTREQRGAHYDEMNRVIAALHRLDVAQLGLGDYGRPGNYFERQIARWTRQYQASITGPNEAMDRLIEWLPGHIPPLARDEAMVSVVHGDFRLDNMVFHPTEPRVLAVLDWELSTIGHPLADFSYHCMAWYIPPGSFRGIGGLDHAALGIPLVDDYVRRYCERSGIGTPAQLKADWNFFLAYNLFRLAAIVQGIAKRIEAGTAASEQARKSAAAARPLADLGWKFAQAAA